MADSSSGRDPKTNAGSDSQRHYTGTAHEQYGRTPATSKATPTTPRGNVVRDNKPTAKADSSGTAPMASGNVLPDDYQE